MIEVTDPDDPRLDEYRFLRTADRRPDRPGGLGLVIAEGTIAVSRMLASRYPLRSMLGVRRKLETLPPVDAPVYVTTAEVMAEVIGFHLNRGVLAMADRPEPLPVSSVIDGARRLAVLEGVGDHENLGALFRNAAALGVDGVLLGAGCSDPLYRRSVRVSMGHVLAVPFTTLSPWPDGLKLLQDNGFTVMALTPDGAADLSSVEPPAKAAVMLGSEGPGLTPEAIAAADVAVKIPMVGGVDSLNVATAGAVTFYALGAGR
ncbi:TrmH family RNA methyltransferase [Actinophytocola sp. NPDC049390]|uniref:TrmH family RNA methyltransferase n=1 Tax=Actinophytocola sp. NPDC049390 TaxID=3363894 RepID=UPI0037936FAB